MRFSFSFHTFSQSLWQTKRSNKSKYLFKKIKSVKCFVTTMSHQVRLGQVRLGQVRLGQVRLGQVRLGQVRLGQVRLGYVRLGQVRLGQVRLGQVRLGQVRLGQVRLGQVRSGQVKGQVKEVMVVSNITQNIMVGKGFLIQNKC